MTISTTRSGPKPRPRRSGGAGCDRASFQSGSAASFADCLPQIVWTADAYGSEIHFNEHGALYVGEASPQVIADSARGWIHPDDLDRVRTNWTTAVRTGDPFEVEGRIRRADGLFGWHLLRAVPTRGSDGGVSGWAGTATDINDRKRLEQELRQSELATTQALNMLDTFLSAAPVGFLLVDRDFRFVRVNERAAAINGISVAEHLGRAVAEVVPGLWPQIEPVYQQVLAGETISNLEMSGQTAARPGQAADWLVSLYPVGIDGAIDYIGVVILDITDRKEAERAQTALVRSSVMAIASVVEARDPYTAGHQSRVAEIATAIAVDLGQDDYEAEGIGLAASIHDIGKIGVPAEILNKPGRLSPLEFELIKQHAWIGHDIVAGIAFPWPVAEMIGQHHERLDGSGYPHGLNGLEIGLGARIIAVADVVDAMQTHRPYRHALGLEAALSTIRAGRDTLFDPDVVDACLRVLENPSPGYTRGGSAAPGD